MNMDLKPCCFNVSFQRLIQKNLAPYLSLAACGCREKTISANKWRFEEQTLWSRVEKMIIGPITLRGRRMSLCKIFQETAAITQHLCWKRNAASYSLYSALIPVQLHSCHSGGTVPLVTPGTSDWLSCLWQRPDRRCGLSFSECVSRIGRGGGRVIREAFPLTNTVTQLPVKWVTSYT